MMAVMDKFVPSYDLEAFKKSEYDMTKTALLGAAALGLDEDGIRNVISGMEKKHFYKSMTSIANHKIWQDVYHVPWHEYTIYVKFVKGIIAEFTVLSFKEK